VKLWHGEHDVFLPLGHSAWLAERIPGAELEVEAGAAHLGALHVLTEVLCWLASSVVRSQV
jgi:pimeloyl-ACP methyl ester carboxylesterase